jgi:hypothetical protein
VGRTARRFKGTQRIVLGGLLAVALLWLLLRGTDWGELGASLASLHPAWLALAEILICASFLARVQRWRYVVRAVQPASYRSLLSATQIGLLVNFTVPARVGELVRAWVLSRLATIPLARSLAMVALDRVNDVIGLLAVLLVAALTLARDESTTFPAGTLGNLEPFTVSTAIVRVAGWSLATAVVAAALGLALLYARRDHALRIARRLLAPLSPALAEKAAALLGRFAEGLHVFRSGPDLARAIAWSLASWGIDVGAAAAVLAAFDLTFPWYTPFVMLSFVAVAILVPLTPGTVGQFHVPAVVALLLCLPELSPSRAKAVAIVEHLATLVPITALGLYCLVRERIGLLDAVRRSTGAPEGEVAGARSGV